MTASTLETTEQAVAVDSEDLQSETPRAEARRAAFLAAAREVFLESGYEGASMAAIVKRAGGGSLSTLYNQYKGKEGLFQAVIDERVHRLIQQSEIEFSSHTPLAEGLQRIGEYYLAQLTSRDSLEMFRMMVAQARKFPDMANAFTYSVPERIRQSLARYLQDRSDAGEIKIRDCEAAAGVFVDMVRARLHLRGLMDINFMPTAEERREMVERAVKVSIGGLGAL